MTFEFYDIKNIKKLYLLECNVILYIKLNVWFFLHIKKFLTLLQNTLSHYLVIRF